MAGALTSPELLGLAVALEADETRRHELHGGFTFFDAAVRAGLVDRMNINGFAISVGDAVKNGLLSYGMEQAGVTYPPPHLPWTDHVLQSRFEYEPTLDGRRLVETSLNIARAVKPGINKHDRIEAARAKLQSGAKVDAVIAVIENVMSPHLFDLAHAHGVETLNPKGKPVSLAALNDALRKADVYGVARHCQIASWLHDRNDTAHGRADDVADRWVELMLDGVEFFVTEVPVATAAQPATAQA